MFPFSSPPCSPPLASTSHSTFLPSISSSSSSVQQRSSASFAKPFMRPFLNDSMTSANNSTRISDTLKSVEACGASSDGKLGGIGGDERGGGGGGRGGGASPAVTEARAANLAALDLSCKRRAEAACFTREASTSDESVKLDCEMLLSLARAPSCRPRTCIPSPSPSCVTVIAECDNNSAKDEHAIRNASTLRWPARSIDAQAGGGPRS